MKKPINRPIWWLSLLAGAFIAPSSVLARTMSGTPQQPQEAGAQQPNPPQDPIAQLNLTPEQRQKIREIREQNKDERAAINQRLRQSQIALNQALDATSPNEALIEQRAREAGEAQAASIRLRVLTETRIRQVLTAEQLVTLRRLRAQAQQLRREQRREDRAYDRGRGVNGRVLPNRRNGIMPGVRRDNLPRP